MHFVTFTKILALQMIFMKKIYGIVSPPPPIFLPTPPPPFFVVNSAQEEGELA